MYYLEILGTLVLFMFLGLFFSPIFGGCLGLIIILMLFGGFIVFFSINFIWFLLAGLVFYSCGWVIKYYRWLKLPDMPEYLRDNPQCKLEHGVACKHCNSSNIEHQGLYNQNSCLRFYTCTSCGHTLYRFNVL